MARHEHTPRGPDPATCTEDELDQWVDDYLEGRLPPQETQRFERALLTEVVAAAFREALVLRELLASMPPDAPPEALVARLEEALELEGDAADRRRRRARSLIPRLPRVEAALAGTSWALRGPAMAFAPAGGAVPGVRDAVSQTAGLVTSGSRSTLAPLTALRNPDEDRPLKPSWWRRALRLGRRKK